MTSRPPATTSHPAEAQWTLASIIAATGMGLVGVVLVLVGYLVASGTTREADQLIGVDIGFGALLVSGGTGVAWLTAGHRCLRARQRRVLAKVGVLDALKAVGATASDPVVATLAAERLVAVRDATYFHRHSCDLARDKVVVSASRREHEQAGRVPCGICGP